MTRNDVPQFDASHRPWWRAPLTISVVGVPILLWEFNLFRGDDYTSPIEHVIWFGLVLFLISWAPPWRQSVQWLRMAVASVALGCAIFPLLVVVVMGAAMASG